MQENAREIAPRAGADPWSGTHGEVGCVAFLAESARALTACDSCETLAEKAVRLAVPAIADLCALYLECGYEPPRAVAERHASGEIQEQMRELEQWRPGTLSGAAAEAIRTGRISALGAGSIAFEPLTTLGYRFALAIPLPGRERAVGALALVLSSSSEREFGEREVKLAEAFANIAALALGSARLREAVAARDEFLSVASHELRTPLSSLTLALQAVSRGMGLTSPAAMAHKLRIAERQAERLACLVDKLLDLSGIGAGRLDLQLEEVDLAAVSRDVVGRMSEEAARSGSKVSVEASRPVVGFWDRMRIEQVLNNLLSNALKYGRAQPVDVSVSVEGERARLCVRDRGLGIPSESQKRIFDRFERAVPGRHYGGLGLGLWIVRRIVEALGGSIEVASMPGIGSTFTVWLPLHDSPAADLATG